MVRPGVELETRIRLRDELRELPGRVIRPQAVRVVASSRGRLAQRDEATRVSSLDAGVRGGGELRVVGGSDRATLRVELWREEELEVRLVPDRPEADERVAGEPARVARGDRAREVPEVGDAGRHHVRRLASVRPARRPGDGQDDLL